MHYSQAIGLIWQLAVVEAAAAKWEYIQPEQFLQGLTKAEQLCSDKAITRIQEQGIDITPMKAELMLVPEVFRACGVDPTQLRRELRRRIGPGTFDHAMGTVVHRSERSRMIFARAEEITKSSGMSLLTTGHLFLAILDEEKSPGCAFIKEKDGDLSELAEKTRARMTDGFSAHEIIGEQPRRENGSVKSSTPILDRYSRDLTQEARDGKLGPIIGRTREIVQIIQTLARRYQNNPLLVGEAGVGKTAIVEALAIHAANDDSPGILGGKRIVELNMGALVAGTKYRGEFEERISGIIEELKRNPNIIIFIDEIHNVVGAGSGSGSMDAANLMKPALARGELCCIGATTVDEYRKYIEPDSALERRFEKIMIPEPSREETIEILQGIRKKLEEHHHAEITDGALEAAVDLSVRFDGDHRLPDKAIDLVDKAGARTQIPILSVLDGMAGDRIEDEELDAKGRAPGEVTELTIAQVLSEQIEVPLDIISGHLEGMSRSRLMEMEAALKQRVIGQDDAIERVCSRLSVAHAGLGRRSGPLGVFLFLGPTGVGKTETVRALTSFLFGTESNMIRLDMSEYMEEHSISKLIGSPPGYVGHEEEGQLTGKLRAKPYSIVLLDEVDKAHPRIFDMFLQIFDDGRLTDAKGRVADARNATFIMTSNIPVGTKVGFRQGDSVGSDAAIISEVRKRFRPEFINRIDEMVVFQPIGRDNVRIIAEKILIEIKRSLWIKYGKSIQWSNAVLDFITEMGYSDRYGVRHLQRTIQRIVEEPLSHLIVSGDIKSYPSIALVVQDDKIILKAKADTI